ncbi:MAG TPA: 2-hydroxyacid dehydrogenase [Candidatus Saccharimonadia bacterium]|nr:2-hydroxyacid dehydrogenase [Candidatus Saccharimonadia bacterium]
MKPEVLLLAPLPDLLLAPLREEFVCHDWHHSKDKDGLLNAHGANIRAIIGAGATTYNPSLMRELPALEIVCVFGVGYDGVPLDYCRQRGIRVTNTPNVLTEDVADIALALVLMTARKLVPASKFLQAGLWTRGSFELTTKPGGKRAGILGLGRIGKAIARRVEAIGMQVGYCCREKQADVPYQYFHSPAEMAAWCHYFIVSCPGGEATKNLVNAQVLFALGSEGTLINIARGTVVDENALISALQGGFIKGAGLDVYVDEPYVPKKLMKMDNVVLLPHVGSGTFETRKAMADLVVGNLKAHFAGKPLPTLVPELV